MRTGELARLAGVSERTLRWYEKTGLLPCKRAPNGYRQYDEEDLNRLQRILFYKSLGFGLEEIRQILSARQELLPGLKTQEQLARSQMHYYERMAATLADMISELETHPDYQPDLQQLIALSADREKIADHYRSARNLNARIALHTDYSTNPQPWYDWLWSQFQGAEWILETGCGNGELWRHCPFSLEGKEIFITDISQGMVEEARHASGLQERASFMTASLEQLPFKNHGFDALIANHVLFYLEDMEQGLKEAVRVLHEEGRLYATTYSSRHMREVTELVQAFDSQIRLADAPLSEKFGLENGAELLGRYFKQVKTSLYHDTLVVTSAAALMDYILSCHGNQNERLKERMEEFEQFVLERLPFSITKEAVLFTASYPLSLT